MHILKVLKEVDRAHDYDYIKHSQLLGQYIHFIHSPSIQIDMF